MWIEDTESGSCVADSCIEKRNQEGAVVCPDRHCLTVAGKGRHQGTEQGKKSS